VRQCSQTAAIAGAWNACTHSCKRKNTLANKKTKKAVAKKLGGKHLSHFIEERLAAGPALAASTPDDFQNKSQRGHFSKLRSRIALSNCKIDAASVDPTYRKP
jgi:hypothetical protein